MTQTQTAITNLRFVRPDDLVIDHKHWTNPRTITGLDDDSIKDIGSDIKARGVQVPLIVQKIWANADKTRFTNLVIEGQRRTLAIGEYLPKDFEVPVVDRTTEPIELTPEAADELMIAMLAVATKREGLSSFEISEVAEKLRNRGKTLAAISKAIGRSEGWCSKILKARSQAQPKLLLKWRKGEITDEQFKELAEVKEPAKQEAAVAEVVKARQSGDVAEARIRAKEIKEGEKQRAAPEPIKDDRDDAPRVVRGPQADLFKDDKPAPPKPAKKPMTARIALEEMLDLAKRRPPTQDYVKGLMDGVRFALAEIGPEDFQRSWTAYLARVDGSGGKAKKGKPSKKAKAKAAKKAAKKTKAKARKK